MSENHDIKEEINPHYNRVNKTYHKAWFYDKDSPYERWQLDILLQVFDNLGKEGCLADIGGGTGRFAQLLYKNLPLETPVLCIDPYQPMLDEAQNLEGVETLLQDAVSFADSASTESFDGFLLKEVVHHVPNDELERMFTGLHRIGRPGAVCAIVTRPKYEIDYPFMEKAKKIWIEDQEDASLFIEAMEKGGFVNCASKVHPFPVKMPLEQWIDMIRDRMWSTFSETRFTPEELEDGIEEIRERYSSQLDDEGNVEFEERIVIVRGEKAAK